MAAPDRPPNPKLRPVEAFPIEYQGRRMVALRDPSGVSEAQVVLSADAFYIVARFDGAHDARDIQADFMRQFGELLPSERITEIADRLDEALLLDGPRFEAHVQALKAAFYAGETRPSVLAGGAYPKDAGPLREYLESLFEPPEGPGAPEQGRRSEPLRALIAPHIDLARGGHAYAASWVRAREGPAPDAVVILGTAHAAHAEGLYILTRKAFETPLGVSKTDPGILDALSRELGEAPFEDEFAHAREHSVEFQVLFAQRCFPASVPIVPILVCSFHEFAASGREPWEDGRVRGFVEALGGACAESGRRVLFVASADFAHVGPKFGDPGAVDDAFLSGVRQSDMELLKRAGELDAPGFFGKIARTRDRTRVCGFSCITTLLLLLEGSPVRGVLRKYGHTIDPTGSAVTFAGMTFEET